MHVLMQFTQFPLQFPSSLRSRDGEVWRQAAREEDGVWGIDERLDLITNDLELGVSVDPPGDWNRWKLLLLLPRQSALPVAQEQVRSWWVGF